jgi:hypothetical protein
MAYEMKTLKRERKEATNAKSCLLGHDRLFLSRRHRRLLLAGNFLLCRSCHTVARADSREIDAWMCHCHAGRGNGSHPRDILLAMVASRLQCGSVRLHSIENHKFGFPAHKLATPATSHFRETLKERQ